MGTSIFKLGKKESFMQKEMPFISDTIDLSGIREGDLIEFSPFLGRKRSIQLNRTQFDFVTTNISGFESIARPKVLDSVHGEKLHFRIEVVEVEGRNNIKRQRYLARCIAGGPFLLNGIYVLKAYIERGDRCEVGHNTFYFKENKIEECFDLREKTLSHLGSAVTSDLPILLEGETGTGKTSLAMKVHEKSGRLGNFVHINISAFSENLIESELFGHVRGAFTGAIGDKKGALREAQGGTLFIDEIDSLSIAAQIKLLLFLDDYTVRPVGGAQQFKVQTRLIFSSGRSLNMLVKQGKMRQDFYYRISGGVNLKLKSLRDELQNIEKFCQLFEINESVVLSPKLIEFYKTLPWPGNYRQLKHHLEKKKELTKGRKLVFDKEDELLITQDCSLESLDEQEPMTLDEVKKAHVKMVYYSCHKNYTKTAQKLSVSVKSVKRILEKDSAA